MHLLHPLSEEAVGSPRTSPLYLTKATWLQSELVAYGSARRALHVIVLYGFSGTYSNNAMHTANEQLLSDVFEEAACRNDLPRIILSDINRQPQDSNACRQACLRGGWLDAGLAAKNLEPTHFPPHGQPRRLDMS